MGFWKFMQRNVKRLVVLWVVVSLVMELLTMLHLTYLQPTLWSDPYFYINVIRMTWLLCLLMLMVWFSRKLEIRVELRQTVIGARQIPVTGDTRYQRENPMTTTPPADDLREDPLNE